MKNATEVATELSSRPERSVVERSAVLLTPPGSVFDRAKRSGGTSSTPGFAGEYTARVTPVPIPNTEVKPRWADGTARVSVWERR
jgi:hypothetical protein